MTFIIEGRGRVIINLLATGEISFLTDSGGATSCAILDKKQAQTLRRALYECIYSDQL